MFQQINKKNKNKKFMDKKIISFIRHYHEKIIVQEEVGLDAVPDQIRKRSIVDGFHVNILVIGRRGLGATTLINSLFISPLIDKDRGDELITFNNEIYENDICLKTSITTYHNNDANDILNFIGDKNSEYFEAEQGLSRPRLDTRIHLAMYLLPTDTVTHEEIHMMKLVSLNCNLVPIISKADSFTSDELKNYKQKMRKIITENNINVFRPAVYIEDDQELIDETNDILQRYPLAIYSSVDSHEFNGDIKRGRLYSWGFLDIENEEINDFTKLRKLIISNNLDEFISTTDTRFYNEYRKLHMETERVDETLRTRRINRIKAEMEKILEERNKSKSEIINNDVEDLEIDIIEHLNLIENDKNHIEQSNSAE